MTEAFTRGHLSVEARFVEISLDDVETLRSIQEDLQPNSMSWSNVCDFMMPEDFHAMAKQCSGPQTKHLLFPMNWTREVCGAFVLDYDDIDARQELADMAAKQQRRAYTKHGIQDYLFVPGVGNPMNHIDAYLASKMCSMD